MNSFSYVSCGRSTTRPRLQLNHLCWFHRSAAGNVLCCFIKFEISRNFKSVQERATSLVISATYLALLAVILYNRALAMTSIRNVGRKEIVCGAASPAHVLLKYRGISSIRSRFQKLIYLQSSHDIGISLLIRVRGTRKGSAVLPSAHFLN